MPWTQASSNENRVKLVGEAVDLRLIQEASTPIASMVLQTKTMGQVQVSTCCLALAGRGGDVRVSSEHMLSHSDGRGGVHAVLGRRDWTGRAGCKRCQRNQLKRAPVMCITCCDVC